MSDELQEQSKKTISTADLSPAAWPAAELARYLDGSDGGDATPGQVEAGRAMVAGSLSAFATYAGVQTLKAGGSAADAAIAAMLAQIAANGGSRVSYAGFLSVMVYDAASKQVHSLSAPYRVPKGETDPLTIPRGGVGTAVAPSGRTAYVPGVIAGAQALHERFGKLPWGAVFEPAIYLTERGFVLGPLASRIESQRGVLGRLPETRAVFFKPDGSSYGAAEMWRQPALAGTLRKVAAEGAGYMYRGAWAERFVAALQREGGRMTMDDLA
ncbi:MAG: gamma-glutamyltransferase, partial [Pseudomonadota bacterium]